MKFIFNQNKEQDQFDITNEHNIKALEKMLDEVADIKLIIVDPIIDFVKVEANTNIDVRAAINKVQALIKRKNIAGLAMAHLNKKVDLSALQRASGASGWVAVARINFLLGFGEDKKTRHLCPLKVNIWIYESPSLDFVLEQARVSLDDIVDMSIPKVDWRGAGQMTADGLAALAKPEHFRGAGRAHGKGDTPALVWLEEHMYETPGVKVPASDVRKASLAAGFSKGQLDRAREKSDVIKCERTKTMPAVWLWWVPDPDGVVGMEQVEFQGDPFQVSG